MEKEKKKLLNLLIDYGVFWSYDTGNIKSINDDLLIEKTLIYLDLDEINLLFDIFSFEKIKSVWKKELLFMGENYGQLNRFLGWFYFSEEK